MRFVPAIIKITLYPISKPGQENETKTISLSLLPLCHQRYYVQITADSMESDQILARAVIIWYRKVQGNTSLVRSEIKLHEDCNDGSSSESHRVKQFPQPWVCRAQGNRIVEFSLVLECCKPKFDGDWNRRTQISCNR